MKILELFSGYGTASFALKRLRIVYDLVGYSDINKFANQIFKQNHCPWDTNDKLQLGDASTINPSRLKDFDLLTGGFPCQAFSIAGKGLGELDTRGTLFNEIIRIAEVKKPRYMMLENVKGLISKTHKQTFNKIISELYRIGYFVKWKVLNTLDYGVPQRRERVFFACFNRWEDFCNFEWPQEFELTTFLRDILEEKVDEKYFLSETAILGKTKSNYQDRKPVYPDGVCSTLKCGGDEKNIIVDEIRETRNVELLENYIKETFEDKPTIVDIYHLLHAEHRPITTFVPNNQLVHRCLQAGVPKEVLFIFNKWRKLTPTECWRLQGFIDGEINVDGISDSQQYKLAGNGQSLNVVEKILKNMVNVENE